MLNSGFAAGILAGAVVLCGATALSHLLLARLVRKKTGSIWPVAWLLLAFGAGGASGSGGLTIWPLFGSTNQILAGLLGGDIDPASCPYLPESISPDLDSEGAAFACAYNTIATFNGNFDSSQDETDQSKDLACSLESLATMPSFYNCDGGDGPKKKRK